MAFDAKGTFFSALGLRYPFLLLYFSDYTVKKVLIPSILKPAGKNNFHY